MSENGELTAAELVTVEDDDRLNRVAAYWFGRARAAWYDEGGAGSCIVERAGAYRSYDVQHAMKYGIPSYAYWNLNPGSKVGLAEPGHSTHGTGDRFDATPGFNAFLLRRGREFGMVREFGDSDPNHWKITKTTIPANADVSVLAELQQLLEDDMTKAIGDKSEIAIINPLVPGGYFVVKRNDPAIANYLRLYSPTRDGVIPADDSDVYLGQLKAARDEATRVQSQLRSLFVGSVVGGSTDLTPVLQAVAALAAKIDGIDEATAATIAQRLTS